MGHIRTFRSIAVATVAMLAASLMTPTNAEAVEFTASRSIVGSGCTKWLKWNGGLPPGLGVSPYRWPKGTVKLCWVKYKLKSDRHADYFAISAQSSWRVAEGKQSYPAEMVQAVSSSIASVGNVYGATGSYTSSRNCTDNVTVSFGVGPFGVSTTPKICDNYGIKRYSFSRSEGQWKSTKAAGLRQIETVFVQKVREGAVPKFDIVFAIPRYKNTWYDAGGYWKSSKRLKWVSWSDR